MTERKIDIGSGRARIDGWETCDANPRSGADYIAELPPVPEEFRGVAAFRLIHVLEHFYRWDAIGLLLQFHEFLKPGGVLILELPNLQSAIDALSGKSGRSRMQWGMWVLYGDPGHKDPLYGHRWGWTPATLTTELRAAGFAHVQSERPKHHVPDRDFRLVARKAG